ncbi:thioredoxin family protein [Rufibacter aurantiacus]|uniref:thioredoxin family protein n=1 Tax=Rufibacter aurantiacus TaxID=2817374 RepID=UPI001B30767A|nr:thioredoxin family protein [Rufibacter aurantiacus]
MNFLVLLFSAFLSFSSPTWLKELDQAKTLAQKEHKTILLNFSGSDWCGPCIKLEKDIFENEAFQAYAAQNLVLVNADFPRLKKNQLDKRQTALNEALAEKYNQNGIFPLTLLLDANGNVIRKWEGIPAKEANAFIALLQTKK